MTPHQVFTKVHLGIFRQTSDSTPANPSFQIVGESYIRVQPRDWQPGAWVTAAVRPIPVQAGDYLGLFYDSLSTLKEQVFIPTQGGDHLKNALTLIFLQDASTIPANSLFQRTVILVSFYNVDFAKQKLLAANSISANAFLL